MKRPSGIAAIAALSLVSALPFAATHASAAPELPKFRIHVQQPRVNEEVIQKIHPGQTQDEVIALIGEPQRTVAFRRSHTVALDYDYRDAWGYEAALSVILD